MLGWERFEDRRLMSTFVVSNTTESLEGSLDWAIVEADANPGSTITFSSSLAGAITLPHVETLSQPTTILGTATPGPASAIDIDASGTNGDGLVLGNGSDGSTIEGLSIVGASGAAIHIQSSDDTIIGNVLGLTSSGAVVSNALGILVDQGTDSTIGGTADGAGNVISGNSTAGIDIEAPCLVEGNRIGTDADGTGVPTKVMPGTGAPSAPGILVGQPGATIGGTATGTGNVISGNSVGIVIEAACLVEGNRIGTDTDGLAAIPNVQDGIDVLGVGGGSTIGGTASGAGNLISGNPGVGLFIFSHDLVQGNLVGTDVSGTAAIPNGVGITVAGSHSTIGGTSPGAGNVIAFNDGPGVGVITGAAAAAAIESNSIFANGGPGIDLGVDGVTPNSFDEPANSPDLGAAVGGTISGTLNATPDRLYTIDLYANPAGDASVTRPQGRTYLGSTTIVTDAAGNASFTFDFVPDAFEPSLTATATALGVTSEFSAPVRYGAPAVGLAFDATAAAPYWGEVAGFTALDPTATADDFAATIDWGDGGPSTTGTVVAAPAGFVVTGSHTFAVANPAEPITVTITDALDRLQATIDSLADVAGPADVVTAYGRTAAFTAGRLSGAVVASFVDSSVDVVDGQFTAAIDWGDGTSSAGDVSVDGSGFDVSGSHTYNFAGTDPVRVTIQDLLTGATITADATANVAPVPITILTRNFAVVPGKAFTGIVATFTDGNPLTDPGFYTATIDWGDGTPATIGLITGRDPFTVTASHTFTTFQQGTDIVTVTITDPNGQTATGVDRAVDPPAAATDPSGSEPAAPPAPTSATASLVVRAGRIRVPGKQVFRGIVATFTDEGPVEPSGAYSAMIEWGKGRKTPGLITGSHGGFVVSARRRFPRFRGTRPVTITVTSTDGRHVSVTEWASEVFRDSGRSR
jgi:hypothetical protein